jgi:hypothetical protein
MLDLKDRVLAFANTDSGINSLEAQCGDNLSDDDSIREVSQYIRTMYGCHRLKVICMLISRLIYCEKTWVIKRVRPNVVCTAYIFMMYERSVGRMLNKEQINELAREFVSL